MHAVFYDPNDNGRILQNVQGTLETIVSDGRPFVQVVEPRYDYDVTHRVEKGKLVEIDHGD